MFGKSSSSVTESGETTPGGQEERIMSSPGMRRPQVWENVDATGPVARTNRIGADWPATRWGATEPTDVRNTDPWPPGALTAANIPVTEPSTEREQPAAPTRPTRASSAATLSLIAGSFAVAATLTGLLAPLGFAAGVVAVLFGVFALRAVRRPTVNGRGLISFGLLFGFVAILLSVLAMSHSASWLSNRTDEITVVHTWLNDHIHWLRRW
jgi:hypothetical protein